MSLLDRFTAGLETLGKKANQALDEGKLRVELSRVHRRMDHAARDLGWLTYRQAKGSPAAPGDVEALTRRIAEGEAEAQRLEDQIAQVKQRGASRPASTPDAGGSAPAEGPPPAGGAPEA